MAVELRSSEQYGAFAALYDRLSPEERYERWAAFIDSRLTELRGQARLVYELGCGTGRLLARLAGLGYHPAGMDASASMLDQARRRLGPLVPLYHDTLPRVPRPDAPVGAVLCVFDTLNYLPDLAAVRTALIRARRLLVDGGPLICDTVSTEVLLRCVTAAPSERLLGGQRILASTTRERHAFFHRVEVLDDLGAGFTETHRQIGIGYQEFANIAWAAGFRSAEAYDDYSSVVADSQSERISWVLRP
ncbi:MAG: class I SAM-dependent methyltransferase [Actinomycetota bacterium]|nr:class I SAM-dependent methyltransferase [Actinomycetota bacterium]MDQ2957958.1 class I SAM-dependent methyltransferase [Actinomycetota bacterium]